MQTPPRVFVSYAHDSPDHRAAVHRLSELLRTNGVDVRLDEWDSGSRRDWVAWMHDQITNSDYVIVIASPAYRKVGDGNGSAVDNRGVQAEAALLRELLYADRVTWTPRLLPVVLPGRTVDGIPLFLQPHGSSHYIIPALTRSGIEQLLRTITGPPGSSAPRLGSPPVFGAETSIFGRRSWRRWSAIVLAVVIVTVVVVVLVRPDASDTPAASGPPVTTTGTPPATTVTPSTVSIPATTAGVTYRWQGTLKLGGYGGPGGGWFLDTPPPSPAVLGDIYYNDTNEIAASNSIVPWNRPGTPSQAQCAALLGTQLGQHTFDAVVGNTACFTTDAGRVGFLKVTATPGADELNPAISVDASVWQKP